jgi:hypothetical protein
MHGRTTVNSQVSWNVSDFDPRRSTKLISLLLGDNSIAIWHFGGNAQPEVIEAPFTGPGKENVISIRQTPRVDTTLPEEDEDDAAISKKTPPPTTTKTSTTTCPSSRTSRNDLEEETRAFANDEYYVEGLSGVWLPFTRQYTGRPVSSLGAIKIKKFLDNQTPKRPSTSYSSSAKARVLIDVPEGHRGAFYRY